MNLATSIRAALIAMSPVTSLVGGSTSATTRIWSAWPRTYTTPCVVIEVDSEDESPHLTGQDSLITASVVLVCRADTDAQANALQRAVRSGMAAYSGSFSVIIESTARSNTPKAEGSADHWYDHSIDCTIQWNEAV